MSICVRINKCVVTEIGPANENFGKKTWSDTVFD